MHNATARNEMLQIVRFLTISKGGENVHWDLLMLGPRKKKTRELWEID
jgi:hypothetical protein